MIWTIFFGFLFAQSVMSDHMIFIWTKSASNL